MTALSLTKGQKLSLTKEFPMSTNLRVGLGWDANSLDTGHDFDLDASAFMLKDNDLVLNPVTWEGFVFYGQPTAPGVAYGGDNRTGSGDGDDETVDVNLTQVRADVRRIVFAATIYEWRKRKQNFGQVRNAYIRLVDIDTNKELCRYNLTENFSTETALLFAELYRDGTEWKFGAIGGGFKDGLSALCKGFGIDAPEEGTA